MIDGKRVLAVVPARGGSKRIPRKNIKLLCGKPLIQWTIESALDSAYIDTVLVSTDDEEIANISIKAGAYVPGLRPPELATDKSTGESVLQYIAQENKNKFDILVQLQPTSPLRTVQDIDSAIEYYKKLNAYEVFSVTKAEHPPTWINALGSDMSMNGFLTNHNARSQDFGDFFRINGAICIFNITQLIDQGISYGPGSFAFEMSKPCSIDIDDHDDFTLASYYLKKRLEYTC